MLYIVQYILSKTYEFYKILHKSVLKSYEIKYNYS